MFLTCMTDQMPFHDGSGFALETAEGAFEPLVLKVDTEVMLVEVVLEGEALTTLLTNIWIDSFMPVHVRIKSFLQTERLVAFAARIFLDRTMALFMLLQIPLRIRSKSTSLTNPICKKKQKNISRFIHLTWVLFYTS